MGTITVYSSDKSTPVLQLQNVKDPVFVKELIHKQVEENKSRARFRVGEVMSNQIDDVDHDFGDMD